MGQEPSSPGFDAAQLAETLDTIGLLVASLSDRVDAQGKILGKVHQTATEARAAAFAAERATDWDRNAASIHASLERALVPPVARLRETEAVLRGGEEITREATRLLEAARLREDQHRIARQALWKRRLPWLFAATFLAGFVLALVAVHVRSQPLCRLLGGSPSFFTESATKVCAFARW